MTITEYTVARAQALCRLNIPETYLSANLGVNIKPLWFDIMTSENITSLTYTGTHSHSFFEIHFVFSGSVCYDCGGTENRLCTGQALVIPPDTRHRYVGCSDELLKLSLAFSAENAPFDHAVAKTMFFSDEIVQNTNFVLRFAEKKDMFAPYIIGGRVLEMIYSVFASLGTVFPDIDREYSDPRLLPVKEYIEKNKHRLINCEDAAKECGLSVKQLSRIFKKETGHSLFDYIVGKRFEYSKKLLAKNELSIKEITYMLGFENESSFVSFFKRQSGMPPGAFRKQNSELPARMSEN